VRHHPDDPRRGRGHPARRAERAAGAGHRRPRLRARGRAGGGRRSAGDLAAADPHPAGVSWLSRGRRQPLRGGTTMSVIKVRDLAYGRLRAPDLDVMEEFLTNFGMIRSARTPNALYMRGTDPKHHVHITEKGDPKFLAFGYYAASEDDLQRVAKAPGASAVESIDEPGGGKRVRLREPNGYQIEVVHGIAAP